jgi:hypothetical protein
MIKRFAGQAATAAVLCLAAGASLLLPSCRNGVEPPAGDDLVFTGPGWFEEVTDKVGLDFVQDSGPVDENYFMPQITGAGAALCDLDGDDRLDIYLLNNAGPGSKSTNRLFKQMKDKTFKDVSAGSGLDFTACCQGVAVGDVNNDGLPDVLVTQSLGVRLFLNQGGCKFKDVTKEAGLDGIQGWATSASFFDYDRDGRLDLFVTIYVDYDASKRCTNPTGVIDYCAPRSFPPRPSKLFHNITGPDGQVRFEEVSLASGIGKTPGPGLGAICADFDGDGWPDIFVANDGAPNHLWINQKNGKFKEEAVKRGVAYNAMGAAEANMGIGWGDVDGDGLFDVFVTHLNTETNTLWKQGPRGQFNDATAFTGLAKPKWKGTGFGTLLGDFDQDGALDAVIVNGKVFKSPCRNQEELGPLFCQYADRNQLFANDGTGKFHDISLQNAPFCQTPRLCRCLAMGDVDGDGALDLLTTAVGGRVRLYRNVAPNRGHWLMVRAVDPALGGRDALGAEVRVSAGARRWVREITTDGGYLTAIDPQAHFGLGAVDCVDWLRVQWPDGDCEEFDGGPVDRVVKLSKGMGRPLVK